MTNYLDRSIESLLARRELAEKATPGPWGQVIAGLERVVIDSKGTVVCTVCLDEDFSDKETERQVLANLYYIAVNSPAIVMADIDEILRLRAQVERLEKEADWLISEKIVEEWNGRFVGAFNADKGGLVVYESQAEAVASWREAARKAVEENHEN